MLAVRRHLAPGRLLAALAAAVYASPCAGCGEGGFGGRLCDRCFAALPRLAEPACEVCDEPLTPGAVAATRCPACLDGRAFVRARALGPLYGGLHDLVLGVKYRGQRSLAYDLGARAVRALVNLPVDRV